MTNMDYESAYRTLAYAINRGEPPEELRHLLTTVVTELRASYGGHRHATGDRVLRRVDNRPATVGEVHESTVDPGSDAIVLVYDDGGPSTAGSHSSAIPMPSTTDAIRAWLLNYAWLGDADAQAREVECIMSQGDVASIVDGLTEKYAGQAWDHRQALGAHEHALSSLYECHDGPHLPTCPHSE